MVEPQLWHWAAFGIGVFILLVLDLKVFHSDAHDPTIRESFGWSVFWISLALIFNGLVWYWFDSRAAAAFLQGYVVEKSLSMDNVFVFVVIFKYFSVPPKYQYRVLFWGVLGAVIMRMVFISGGIWILSQFEWVLWIFGAFLLYTGVKLAMHDGADVHPEKNFMMRLASRWLPFSREDHGQRFTVRVDGKLMFTKMFLVLLVIESTDVVFAVDSVPAIIGIVKEWHLSDGTMLFVAFTSNVFAILGLRALYFLLAGAMSMFRYLPLGLSAILIFIGAKMVATYWVPILWTVSDPEHFHLMPAWVSMVVIFGILGLAMIASIVADRRAAWQTVPPPRRSEFEEASLPDEPSPPEDPRWTRDDKIE